MQTNGVRKTFTSSIPGRRGKIDAERKADIWLDTQIVGENAKASATIAQYLETIDATASSSYRAQQHYYMGMVLDCIGNKKMVNITPRDLQAIVDKYYRFALLLERKKKKELPPQRKRCGKREIACDRSRLSFAYFSFRKEK